MENELTIEDFDNILGALGSLVSTIEDSPRLTTIDQRLAATEYLKVTIRKVKIMKKALEEQNNG